MRTETLPDGHEWMRLAERAWDDPLDPSFAQRRGGRWNPPGSWPTLYLNEDVVTARLNLRAFAADRPYALEDLRAEHGPDLVVATLPRQQQVLDVHTPAGVAAVELPDSYPLDERGELVARERCQRVGAQAKDAGLRGVRCRSARVAEGAGREVAWFPATARSRAKLVRRIRFSDWYWA